MVCHETYKDEKGNWLYPDEVKKISSNNVVKKMDNKKVIVGPSESMSKSKKNTIDPETIITKYGADSVRWFILSDSPPEKDVQWSDTGVSSSNKFLQKIWNLNNQIITRKEDKINEKIINDFNSKIDKAISKIDNTIEEFRFNVTIAQFYEIYKIFINSIKLEISNECLISNMTKVMKLMIPLTPHLAYECLELLKCDSVELWPNINRNLTNDIEFAVQVNGKTRDIVSIKRNLSQEEIYKIVIKDSKQKNL